MAKPKYKSRAARASDLASEWKDLASQLEALKEENDPEDVDPEIRDAFIKDVLKDAKERIEMYFTTGELDSLRDEMSSWRDNYPENMQSGDRYSTISEACDSLDAIDDETPTIDSFDDFEAVIDDLERRASDLEEIEFPGMYG